MEAATHGPAAGLARLRVMATDGRLDELCERHGIAVLTVFAKHSPWRT